MKKVDFLSFFKKNWYIRSPKAKRLSDFKFDTFAGIDNNETIKVYRSGGADPDGDHPGDLYVIIKVL